MWKEGKVIAMVLTWSRMAEVLGFDRAPAAVKVRLGETAQGTRLHSASAHQRIEKLWLCEVVTRVPESPAASMRAWIQGWLAATKRIGMPPWWAIG